MLCYPIVSDWASNRKIRGTFGGPEFFLMRDGSCEDQTQLK